MEGPIFLGLMLIAIVIFALIGHMAKKGFQGYLDALPAQDRVILQEYQYPLLHSMDLVVKNIYRKEEGYEFTVRGEKRILDFLYRLGGFDENHLRSINTEFTLDGHAALLSWKASTRFTLQWLQPIVQAWIKLGEAKRAIDEDPNNLFHTGLWPDKAHELVVLFLDQADRARIRDEELRKVFSGLSDRTRIPLAMILRPPGEFWQGYEAAPHLKMIPAPLLQKALDAIGPQELAKQKPLLWAKILGMPPSGEQQKAALSWLEDHPQLILQEQLMTDNLFTQDRTAAEALHLLMHFPNADSLKFLGDLMQGKALSHRVRGMVMEAKAKLTQKLGDVSGNLSFSSIQDQGGISESD